MEPRKKNLWKRLGIWGIAFFVVKGTITTLLGYSLWEWLSGLFK